MVSARSEEFRQALVNRVARRVEGQGVPPTAVDAAVTRVPDALGEAIGIAAAHGHHVATVRVPDAARCLVHEVVGKQGWTLSFVTEEGGR